MFFGAADRILQWLHPHSIVGQFIYLKRERVAVIYLWYLTILWLSLQAISAEAMCGSLHVPPCSRTRSPRWRKGTGERPMVTHCVSTACTTPPIILPAPHTNS